VIVPDKPMETERWAAAHYRVERETSGLMMRKRQRKKATATAAELGQPAPEPPHDVVRIFDRSGEIVFERDWGTSRPEAMDHEARIVDDLLHLDVLTFRAKYGISSPGGGAVTLDAQPAGPEATAGQPPADPGSPGAS
jgi:hypothetical protein